MALVDRAGKLAQNFLKTIGAVGFLVRSGVRSDITADPTITSGTGAASEAQPDGSLFLRTDGGAATALYVREDGAWVLK